MVRLGYYKDPGSVVIGRSLLGVPVGEQTQVDLSPFGRVEGNHGFKYSHYRSGQAHFSFDDPDISTRVVNQTTPRFKTVGHLFSVHFGGFFAFDLASEEDSRPPSNNRTALTFNFGEREPEAGKIIGWWYPIHLLQIAQFGNGPLDVPRPVQVRGKDGNMLTGFLVGPPKNWGWIDFVLFLSDGMETAPTKAIPSMVLLTGGMVPERDEAGNDIGLSMLTALLSESSADPEAENLHEAVD